MNIIFFVIFLGVYLFLISFWKHNIIGVIPTSWKSSNWNGIRKTKQIFYKKSLFLVCCYLVTFIDFLLTNNTYSSITKNKLAFSRYHYPILCMVRRSDSNHLFNIGTDKLPKPIINAPLSILFYWCSIISTLIHICIFICNYAHWSRWNYHQLRCNYIRTCTIYR